jgi:hypothetical protein
MAPRLAARGFKERFVGRWSEFFVKSLNDRDQVIQSGKARPEDRKPLAELSGLTEGDQINVNIAVDNTG